MAVPFKLAKMIFNRNKDSESSGPGIIRLLPYVLIIPIILFEALSLSGCASTSPAIPNIYIVSLQPNRNVTSAPLVRIGYFGICGNDGTSVRCQSSSGGSSVDAVMTNLFPTFDSVDTAKGTKTNGTKESSSSGGVTAAEVRDLVATALDLQSQIFISILVGAVFVFCAGVVVLVFHKRDAAKADGSKPKRTVLLRRGTYGLLYLSTALVFAAALATTETASALQYASSATRSATILMHASRTLQALQWMAFGFSTLFVLAVPMLARPRAAAAPAFKGDV